MEAQEEFMMSPKLDIAFKWIFGDERNKDLLISFLSVVLRVPRETLIGIKIINTELYAWYKEDRKGILDIRVKTKDGKQIDIEIQVTPTTYMPERSLYYWSKMYSTQMKSGDTYDMIKKCITINIVDFKCTDIKKLHTVYHLFEDETKCKLTDIIEIHFLELSKLKNEEVPKDENDPVVQWMEFLNSKSKGVMKMLAEKNEDIQKAVDILEVLSKDKNARMAYEAREAQLKDEMTRIKVAEEKGREEGIEKGEMKKAIEDATNFLRLGVSKEIVAKGTELPIEKIEEIQEQLQKEYLH